MHLHRVELLSATDVVVNGSDVFQALNMTNPTNGAAGVLNLTLAPEWFTAAFNAVDISLPFFFTIGKPGENQVEQPVFQAFRTSHTLPCRLALMYLSFPETQ